MIDYAMPFRCMQYDIMEYGKQLDTLRKRNRQENNLQTAAEKICGLRKNDRIIPVYTICLYHGMESWDGPRTLGDMMDFGDGKDGFRTIFKEYPMHLYCLNEIQDMQVFHSEVGMLFEALQYRKDRAGLKQLIVRDARYQRIDADTLEIMSIMLELPSIWQEREKYMEKNDDDREEFNMCQAIREWAEEERSIGRMEGSEEKTYTIVRNMLMRDMPDTDIMAIAECDQEYIDKVRADCNV